MKKVAVIPYCDGKVMVEKLPYNSFNSYKFASSEILYEDLPTTLNDDKEEIIDVTPYYTE